VPVFVVNWQNCAIWSGTLTYSPTLEYFSPAGYSRSVSGDSVLKIPPQADGAPPPPSAYEGGHVYQTKDSSASGRMLEHNPGTCAVNGVIVNYQDSVLSTWGGSLRLGNEIPEVEIHPLNRQYQGQDMWWMSFANGGIFPSLPPAAASGHVTVSGQRRSDCSGIPPTDTDVPDWTLDVFGFWHGLDAGDVSDYLVFTIAPGAMTADGQNAIPAGENVEGYLVAYHLVKTCSMGGTSC
jgi:hypothetical protein